jgi:hypothetical protein
MSFLFALTVGAGVVAILWAIVAATLGPREDELGTRSAPTYTPLPTSGRAKSKRRVLIAARLETPSLFDRPDESAREATVAS